MTWQVYGLYDPTSDSPFYVGCTTDLKRRMSQHRVSKNPVGEHFRKHGDSVFAKVYGEYKKKDVALFWERVTMCKLVSNGVVLLNKMGHPTYLDQPRPLHHSKRTLS